MSTNVEPHGELPGKTAEEETVIHFLFRLVTPYLLGVCIGVGFFFLLIQFVAEPEGLVRAVKEAASTEPWQNAANAPPSPPRSPATSPPKTSETPGPTPSSSPSPIHSPLDRTSTSVSKPVADPRENDRARTAPPSSPKKERATASTTAKPPESRNDQEGVFPRHCGFPPPYPGADRDRFMACQRRNECLAYRHYVNRRLSQDHDQCLLSGGQPTWCHDHFAALRRSFDPADCNRISSPTRSP